MILAHGERVVATLRTPEVLADLIETYGAKQILAFKCDVARHEDIIAAFDAIRTDYRAVSKMVQPWSTYHTATVSYGLAYL